MKLVKTGDLPELGVSHDPNIKKKVFIPRGEIPIRSFLYSKGHC